MSLLEHGITRLKEILKTIPKKPGVYKMLGENGSLLYVGKAKNLANRLTSYTQPNNLSNRLSRLVSQIASVDYILTTNEMEALILECNLIKSLRPPFNILMRDDKSYAYLKITKNHPYPSLTKYRGNRSDDAYYFGPYPFGAAADITMTYLQKIFKIRNCNDTEFNNRKRPCLQYFIKRCSAPCVQYIEPKDYGINVQNTKKFLNGKTADVHQYLTQKMNEHSTELEFEQAAQYRDKLQLLNYLKTKQSLNIEEADIFYIHQHNHKLYVEVLLIRYGRDLGHQSFPLDHSEQATLNDGMASFLLQFYDKYQIQKQIYLNTHPQETELIQEYLQTKTQEKIDLQVLDSTHQLMKLIQKHMGHIHEDIEHTLSTLSQMLACNIKRIECYDNSHTQGAHAYGVMVVATPVGFVKSLYKSFQIRALQTGDDYEMMRQVLRRRLHHKDWLKPDLILVDGGKGQLSAAQDVLKELEMTITVVAIAKGEKRNDGHERFFVNDETELILDDQSPVRYFLQRLRDEAHRFAITLHTKKRDIANRSHVDQIPGIGPGRKKALLQHFGSIKLLALASVDDLQLVKGISPKLAKTIWQFFKNQ